MKVNSILETIGNTPHVRINRLFDPAYSVWVKLERANPGSSIKDRIALSMLEAGRDFFSHDSPQVGKRWGII